jgi:hypothetical protein
VIFPAWVKEEARDEWMRNVLDDVTVSRQSLTRRFWRTLANSI